VLARRPPPPALAHRRTPAGRGATPHLPCPRAMLCGCRSLRLCVGRSLSSPSFSQRFSWRCGASAGAFRGTRGSDANDSGQRARPSFRGSLTTRAGHRRRGAPRRSDVWTPHVFWATLLLTMGRSHAQGVWTVMSGSGCGLSPDGMCVTDGDGTESSVGRALVGLGMVPNDAARSSCEPQTGQNRSAQPSEDQVELAPAPAATRAQPRQVDFEPDSAEPLPRPRPRRSSDERDEMRVCSSRGSREHPPSHRALGACEAD
jgi:hypothetical protein